MSTFAKRLIEIAANMQAMSVEFSSEQPAKYLNTLIDMAFRLENIAHAVEPDPRRSATLTPKQTEILSFIRDFIAQHGVAPTRAEIAAAFYCATNAIQEHIVALARKGHITLQPGVARGIRLNKRPTTLTLSTSPKEETPL